jgi:hypothetical protein
METNSYGFSLLATVIVTRGSRSRFVGHTRPRAL